MQVNWALWQQPTGGTGNYNLQFQSFHCAVVPQTLQTQINNNSSWQQQLQQTYIGLLSQAQSLLRCSSYSQFGSTQVFNSTVSTQNYPGYNYSSSQTKAFSNFSNKTSDIPSDNLETMEPKDFVSLTRFNAYAVNFKNINAISEDQVHDIFSVFGKIKRVKQTGDEHGLCFVNFETEEDAIKAAAGVKNHPEIRLRPAKLNRLKNENGEGSGDNGNNFSHGSDENSNGNGNGKRNYSNGNDNYNGNRRNYSNGNRRNNFNDNYSNDNNKTDCFNDSEDKSVVPTSSEIKTSDKEPEVSDYNNKLSNETPQKSDTSASIEKSPVNNDKICDQRSTISKPEVQIPDLVAKISKMSMASSKENVDALVPLVPIEKMAVEVFVGNIPEGLNVHAILQLMNKYHPLAATDVLIYKPSQMRYCRVYFTSQQRAEDVEEEFNNCVLMDKQLLVMRASRLVN